MSIVHGGNLEKLAAEAHCAPDEILDFSVNLNPCGQPKGLFQVWFRAFEQGTSCRGWRFRRIRNRMRRASAG